ncbi:MAG TPA: ice-binding family protein [Gemmatimonadaceae bacterium]
MTSAACSNDAASRVNAPPLLPNTRAGSSASASGLSLGAASSFAVLSAAPNGGGAVTCTNTPPPTTITGDVGSSGGPASVVNTTGCTINGAIIAPVSAQVLDDFNSAYAALAGQSCDQFLTGTLDGVTLTPGVYCFAAAATLTGTLTLSGPSNGTWLFKIGTSGTGALTGTNFKVVMSGGDPCNVTWWVAEAATMTTSNFIGTILAGAAITVTSGTVGTFNGRALAKAAVTITGGTLTGCTGGSLGGTVKAKCNQGVGNGPEGCDPGNSNNRNPSNDERGGTPGNPGRKGGH